MINAHFKDHILLYNLLWIALEIGDPDLISFYVSDGGDSTQLQTLTCKKCLVVAQEVQSRRRPQGTVAKDTTPTGEVYSLQEFCKLAGRR